MQVIFCSREYRGFIRIRNREQLNPAHYSELVKKLKKMFWGSFNFAALMLIEGMMNLYKYIDVIEEKSQYKKGIS